MGQVLNGSATTTHAVRAAIQRSQGSAVDKLVERSTLAGIDVHLETQLKSIKKSSECFIVSGEKNGKDQQWTVDLVVHGAGRVPAIDVLNLQAAGVESGNKGVVVNEYLQSVSNTAIYAAGDAAGGGRALAFSVSTRNSLVVLPLALAAPFGGGLVAAVVVTQTLVELLAELVYVRLVPRLVPG